MLCLQAKAENSELRTALTRAGDAAESDLFGNIRKSLFGSSPLLQNENKKAQGAAGQPDEELGVLDGPEAIFSSGLSSDAAFKDNSTSLPASEPRATGTISARGSDCHESSSDASGRRASSGLAERFKSWYGKKPSEAGANPDAEAAIIADVSPARASMDLVRPMAEAESKVSDSPRSSPDANGAQQQSAEDHTGAVSDDRATIVHAPAEHPEAQRSDRQAAKSEPTVGLQSAGAAADSEAVTDGTDAAIADSRQRGEAAQLGAILAANTDSYYFPAAAVPSTSAAVDGADKAVAKGAKPASAAVRRGDRRVSLLLGAFGGLSAQWDTLPVKLLARVFLCLHAVDCRTLFLAIPQICRKWASVCRTQLDIRIHLEWISAEHRTDEVLSILVDRFPKAVSLAATGSKLTDIGLQIASRCSQLRSVDVRQCELVSDLGLRNLAARCSRLQEVRLSRFSFTDSTTTMAAFSQLTSIDVSYSESVTDFGLLSVALRCPGLRSLNIHSCPNITNDGLHDLATRCTQLEYLDMGGCNIGDHGLATVARFCPQIGTLLLRSCWLVGDFGLQSLGIHSLLDNLRTLDLSNCESITGAGLASLVQAGTPRLTQLNLEWCENLTDAGLVSLAQCCPALSLLNVSGCAKLTDRGVAALVSVCTKLTALDISHTSVSDSGVAHVGHMCRLLSSLELSGLRLTDAGLRKVAAGCPRLRHLDLAFCRYISDDGLEFVAAACPKLQTLNLSCCSNVTDRAIGMLAACCGELKFVDATDCRRVTPASTALISLRYPAILLQGAGR